MSHLRCMAGGQSMRSPTSASVLVLVLVLVVLVNNYHVNESLLAMQQWSSFSDDPLLGISAEPRSRLQELDANNSVSSGALTVARNDISLVISFWAESQDDQRKPHPHRLEVEVAMLTNLLNTNLNQLVVILDSVSDETSDCAAFVEYMGRRRDSITGNSSVPLAPLPELTCIERRELGQPTYFEMFRYATFHPSVTSDIVIISNGDQVFDDTLSHARAMSNTTIFVLSTHGYEPEKVPTRLRNQYLALVGNDSSALTDSENWSDQRNRCVGKLFSKKKNYSDSWDTYIFRRSLLRDTLQKSEHQTGGFTRLSHRRRPTPYYMNELAAEYAALYDITSDLLGKATVWNACNMIRSWHFHLAEKTHHRVEPTWPRYSNIWGRGFIFYEDYGPTIPRDKMNLTSTRIVRNDPDSLVPPPYAFVPMCSDGGSCYEENHRDGSFFHSAPLKDAVRVRQAQLTERHEAPKNNKSKPRTKQGLEYYLLTVDQATVRRTYKGQFPNANQTTTARQR
jgi:hypothetical protein